MPLLRSHMHDRTYVGEKTAEPLIEWLNSQSRSLGHIGNLVAAAERRRQAVEPTREVFQRMVSALGIKGQDAQSILSVEAAKPDRGRRGMQSVFRVATAEINLLLSKYRLTPRLFASEDDRWTIDWGVVSPSSISDSEATALLRFLNLASQGLLSRVRKCRNADCGLWFYARFSHQKCHSAGCQQQVYRSDQKWKAHRCEYMKQLRQLHKRRVVP
jgi:hypothetical protein